MRRMIWALVLAALLAASPIATPAGEPGPAAAATRPTIVLVLTDDQRFDTLGQMPATSALIADQGVRFANAMVPTSLCCPSRASILTGRYAHETHVWSNLLSLSGGWSPFHNNGNEDRTIAVHLKRAGYRTALMGKYLNLYGSMAPVGYVPPGWDVFDAFRTGDPTYYDYMLTDRSTFGHDAADYSTDVLADRAVRFIRTTDQDQPLFLYFAPFAPHLPYTPAPRHEGAWEGRLEPYDPPSRTSPVDDKPAWIKRRLAYTPEADQVQQVGVDQAESLMAVDEAVGRLVGELALDGRLDNTLFVFMSDNGYMRGEHRQIAKNAPYDTSIRIPMTMRWDGRIPAGTTDTRLALNIDVSQTILDAAGLGVTTSGRNLRTGPRRGGLVLENERDPRRARPAYCGWRTRDWMYVRYTTGEEEMYYYRDDPYELDNLAGEPAHAEQQRYLRAKARSACRPAPPTFRW